MTRSSGPRQTRAGHRPADGLRVDFELLSSAETLGVFGPHHHNRHVVGPARGQRLIDERLTHLARIR